MSRAGNAHRKTAPNASAEASPLEIICITAGIKSKKDLGAGACRSCATAYTSPTYLKASKPNLLKHILRLLVGNPCPHCDSTNPFWQLTIQPSNLQTLHCNHRVQTWFRLGHIPRLADLGTPCCGPCNTTPSCPQTNQPANSQNHLRNCKGPLDRLVPPVQVVQILAVASVVE